MSVAKNRRCNVCRSSIPAERPIMSCHPCNFDVCEFCLSDGEGMHSLRGVARPYRPSRFVAAFHIDANAFPPIQVLKQGDVEVVKFGKAKDAEEKAHLMQQASWEEIRNEIYSAKEETKQLSPKPTQVTEKASQAIGTKQISLEQTKNQIGPKQPLDQGDVGVNSFAQAGLETPQTKTHMKMAQTKGGQPESPEVPQSRSRNRSPSSRTALRSEARSPSSRTPQSRSEARSPSSRTPQSRPEAQSPRTPQPRSEARSPSSRAPQPRSEARSPSSTGKAKKQEAETKQDENRREEEKTKFDEQEKLLLLPPLERAPSSGIWSKVALVDPFPAPPSSQNSNSFSSPFSSLTEQRSRKGRILSKRQDLTKANEEICKQFHLAINNFEDLQEVATTNYEIAKKMLELVWLDTELTKHRYFSEIAESVGSPQQAPKMAAKEVTHLELATELVEVAKLAQSHFDEAVRNLVTRARLSFVRMRVGPVKKVERLAAKMAELPNPLCVCDLNRATILCDTEGEFNQILRNLCLVFGAVAKMKNKFKMEEGCINQPPCLMYHLELRLPQAIQDRLAGPWWVELQMTTSDFLEAKELCHPVYEITRAKEKPEKCPLPSCNRFPDGSI